MHLEFFYSRSLHGEFFLDNLSFFVFFLFSNFTVRLWNCDISLSLATYPKYCVLSSTQQIQVMYINKLVSLSFRKQREKRTIYESKMYFPSALSQWMLVYHPGLKDCLAYESKGNTESNNGSISCLISDIVKHILFHLIFIKVPKRDRSPD